MSCLIKLILITSQPLKAVPALSSMLFSWAGGQAGSRKNLVVLGLRNYEV